MDAEALRSARDSYPHVEWVHQTGTSLPFADDEFDAVVLSDVLEHVPSPSRQVVLGEAHRVLTPGGTLLLTSPHAGLSAPLDPMDFKRRFPKLYRRATSGVGRASVDPAEMGHVHLRYDELVDLLGPLRVQEVRFCGFFDPIFSWVLAIGEGFNLLPSWLVRRLDGLRAWESGVPYPRQLAYHVRIVAQKPL